MLGLSPWTIVIALGIGAMSGAVPAYVLEHNARKAEVGRINLTISKKETDAARGAIAQLTGWISNANLAASDYQDALLRINRQYTDINRKLADVSKASPLPLDCRPGPARLSILRGAITTTNAEVAPATP